MTYSPQLKIILNIIDMEKIVEKFSPVYHEVEQVKRCAILGEPVVDVQIAIVIGHNGKNFVSSTDWRLKTKSGAERVFTFFIHPQYPNFVEVVSGVHYFLSRNDFFVQPDVPEHKKDAIVIMDGKEYHFGIGEALKIYVEPNSKFIATDCVVWYRETDTTRIYSIMTDSLTAYGYLDNKGNVSCV